MAGAKSCYPEFVPRILNVFPCLHFKQSLEWMSSSILNGRMVRSCLLDGTCSKALVKQTQIRGVGNMLYVACVVLQMEMVVKKYLLTRGDPLRKRCWNLCAQVYSGSGSRSTIVMVVFCRGGGGLVGLFLEKVLGWGWKPAAEHRQTGYYWNPSRCGYCNSPPNWILGLKQKTKNDIFIQLHCCKPFCCKRTPQPNPGSVVFGVTPAEGLTHIYSCWGSDLQ